MIQAFQWAPCVGWCLENLINSISNNSYILAVAEIPCQWSLLLWIPLNFHITFRLCHCTEAIKHSNLKMGMATDGFICMHMFTLTDIGSQIIYLCFLFQMCVMQTLWLIIVTDSSVYFQRQSTFWNKFLMLFICVSIILFPSTAVLYLSITLID